MAKVFELMAGALRAVRNGRRKSRHKLPGWAKGAG